jgi:hypothetical protein
MPTPTCRPRLPSARLTSMRVVFGMFVCGVVFSTCGCQRQAMMDTASRPTRSAGRSCNAPSNVLAGVWGPDRLRVLSTCRIAVGTVIWFHHEPDGDLHIYVALEAAYTGLMNAVNQRHEKGALLAEFMPRDGGHLPPPALGDHIRVTGAWVLDTNHGWNELHPVWSVQVNGGRVRRSGPQYGGSPPYDDSSDAAEGCRTAAGGPCRGYPEGEGR